jgi:PTS system galactitol-specific IIA component
LKNNVLQVRQLLKPENILIQEQASGYEEIIRKLCKLLEKGEYVTKEFEDACVEREHEMPTGLPTKPYGVAIPHSDPSNVLKPGIAISTLRKSVLFKEMGNPDSRIEIGIVCLLAINNPKKQIQVLKRIATIVRNQGFIHHLMKAESPENVISIFLNAK